MLVTWQKALNSKEGFILLRKLLLLARFQYGQEKQRQVILETWRMSELNG